MSDLSSIGDMYCDIFTYTNVGGVYDAAYQLYRGKIGGYHAAGLIGANALGGKAGGKAYNDYLSRKAPLQMAPRTRTLGGNTS